MIIETRIVNRSSIINDDLIISDLLSSIMSVANSTSSMTIGDG